MSTVWDETNETLKRIEREMIESRKLLEKLFELKEKQMKGEGHK